MLFIVVRKLNLKEEVVVVYWIVIISVGLGTGVCSALAHICILYF